MESDDEDTRLGGLDRLFVLGFCGSCTEISSQYVKRIMSQWRQLVGCSGMQHILLALSLVGVAVPEMDSWALRSLSVIVEVDGDREKVSFRGPRWVCLSSGRSRCRQHFERHKEGSGGAASGIKAQHKYRL